MSKILKGLLNEATHRRYGDNRTGFSRGPRDDERHDLDVQQPSKQEWALKINGKVWSKDGKTVTFASKEQALKARQSLLAKRPELEVGLVSRSVAESQLDELSNTKLSQYKTAAASDASKADSEGNHKRGNKRFSGIVKATKKQFDNDKKKSSISQGINEFEGDVETFTAPATNKPPSHGFAIKVYGPLGRGGPAAAAIWEALSAVFPKQYPPKDFNSYGAQLASPQASVLNQIKRSGSAIVADGISGRDMAETLAHKLATFNPTEPYINPIGKKFVEVIEQGMDEATEQPIDPFKTGYPRVNNPKILGTQNRAKSAYHPPTRPPIKKLDKPLPESLGDELTSKSIQALQQVKQQLEQQRMAELEQWEKDFKQNTVAKFTAREPNLRQRATSSPMVAMPGEKHSDLKTRLGQLNKAIEKQGILDNLVQRLDKKGLLTPNIEAGVDTGMLARDGARDNYVELNRKLDKALEYVKNRLLTNKAAYAKPKGIDEDDSVPTRMRMNDYMDLADSIQEKLRHAIQMGDKARIQELNKQRDELDAHVKKHGMMPENVEEEWSQKYKSSINCSHPKGFSQKAHCAGKKKHNESIDNVMEMTCPDCGMCETHGDHENLDEACWKGYHKEGNKKMFGKTYPNCVKNEGVAEGVAENNTAAGITKAFNNLGDPVFANLQRVALLAMQGRQSEAAGRLQTVIKDADPAVQKKITDAVNNIKPVTINGRVADSSTLDKSKQHNDWIINTFIPWVQSLLGQQGVAEALEQQLVTIYTNPAYKGATVDDRIKKSLPVTEAPFNKLQMWENGKSMKDPKVAQWVNNNLLPQLKQNGKLGPLVVWNNKGKLFVIDGNHRFIAYQAAGYNGNVPVQIVPDKMINIVDTVPGQQGVAEAQHSCPHCGGEMVSEELMNEKKDACYYKVKSRYKVWPSAYASGALVKCRKKGASNWGNGGKKNESSILEGIEQADESLHDWFNKEKWVRMDTKGKIKGPCAREPGEGKPKCLPQSKAHSLGKKGRASAAQRKRREDPNPDRSGKAINVDTKKKSNENVDEGWKQKLGAAALTGAMALGTGAAHGRVTYDADGNQVGGMKPTATQQATDPAPAATPSTATIPGQGLVRAERADRQAGTVTVDGQEYKMIMLEPGGIRPRGGQQIVIPQAVMGERGIGNYMAILAGGRVFVLPRNE